VGSGLGPGYRARLAVKDYRVFGTAMSAEEIADLKRRQSAADKSDRMRHTRRRCQAWAGEVANQNEGARSSNQARGNSDSPDPLRFCRSALSGANRSQCLRWLGCCECLSTRAAKRHGGRVVQVSTMTALCRFPSTVPLGASKPLSMPSAAVYRAGAETVWHRRRLAVAGNMKPAAPPRRPTTQASG